MSILWSISSAGDTRSMVLGTMHVQSRSAFVHIDRIKKYLGLADVYFGETDIGDLRTMALDDFGHSLGKSSFRSISPKRIEKWERIARKAFGLDIRPYLSMHPMFLINALGQRVLSKDYSHALDSYLWSYAEAIGLECLGLEKVEEQQAYFEQLDVDWLLNSLKEIFSNVSKFRKSTKVLAQCYAAQEVRKLYQISKKQLGPMRHILIYERNEKMVQKLLEYLPKKNLFVAVGAGHLPGERGILRKLKHAGYRVEPAILG